MFYRKLFNDGSASKKLLLGIQIDNPKVFIPWDISEMDFVELFKCHGIDFVVEKNYYVKNVTLFGENHCNIGVTFEKTIRKIGISRDNCEEDNSLKDKLIKTPEGCKIYLEKSFKSFQIALEKEFGKPTKRSKNETGFDECEWDIGKKIKIYHYVMDRFGLAEYLWIERI